MVPKIVTHFMLIGDLPQPLCGITAVFSAFTFFFHPMVLAMIACIRYLVIVPWTNRSRYVTLPRLQVAFGIIFSFAVIFSILPYLGVGVYKYSKYHGVCFADWEPENRVFRSIFYVFVIGVAFPVLTFAYTKLFLVLRAHNRDMKATIHNQYSFRNPQFTKIRSESARPYDNVNDMDTTVGQKFEMKVYKEEGYSTTFTKEKIKTQRKSRSFSAIEFTEFSKLRHHQQQQEQQHQERHINASSCSKNNNKNNRNNGTEGPKMIDQHSKSKSTLIDFLKISEKTEKQIYRTMTLSTTTVHRASQQHHDQDEIERFQHQHKEQHQQRYGRESVGSIRSTTSAASSSNGYQDQCSNCGVSEGSSNDAVTSDVVVSDNESVCTVDEEITTTTTTTTVTMRKTKKKEKTHQIVFVDIKEESNNIKETKENNNNNNSNTSSNNNNMGQTNHIEVCVDGEEIKNTSSCNRCGSNVEQSTTTTSGNVKPSKPGNTNITKITKTSMTESKRRRTKMMLGRSLSKQEYQFTKLMILIFLAYIVCWFPAAVVNVMALINTCNVSEMWYAVIVTMVELKSCLNPLIYGIGNGQYRARIVVFFKKYFGFIGRCWH